MGREVPDYSEQFIIIIIIIIVVGGVVFIIMHVPVVSNPISM